MAEQPLALEVTCSITKKRLDNQEDLLLLDCREENEHEISNIPQAMLMPMSEITERAEELKPYIERPIIVFCHHGGRSLRVTNWLREQGYSQAQSMSGGIDAWAIEIAPGMPRY